MLAPYHCIHCGASVSREHSELFLYACTGCGQVSSMRPYTELKYLWGRKIQSPSVLLNSSTVTINGTFFRITGKMLLSTTGVARMVYVLLTNTDQVRYLFECMGRFFLGGDGVFDPGLDKPVPGRELEHNKQRYMIASIERIRYVQVNGAVMFPFSNPVRTYLLHTFEQKGKRLLVMVQEKEKLGMVMSCIDINKISGN